MVRSASRVGGAKQYAVAGADLRHSCISPDLLFHVSGWPALSASTSGSYCPVLHRFVLDLHGATGATFETQRISLRIHRNSVSPSIPTGLKLNG